MAKKIVEVPEGAVSVIFVPAVKANYANKVSYMLKHQVGVENLPDAPEKRVIELPADSIAWLERIKSNLETIDVYDLLNNILDDDSWSYHAYQFNFNSETSALNTVAEWLLGNVEFVPKKEPKFYVDNVKGKHLMVDEQYGDVYHYPQVGVLNDYQYTEAEADKLVAGLTALNARKVKVEEQ